MQPNKKPLIIIIIIIVLLIIGLFIWSKKVNSYDSLPETVTAPVTTATSTATTTTTTTTYTALEVSTHATTTDCWSIVNNNVYNLTPFVPYHPGGPKAILKLCGQDGSASFDAQHGGKKRPASELEKYFIGVLKI